MTIDDRGPVGTDVRGRGHGADRSPASLVDLTAALLRQRRIFLFVPIALLVIVVAITLLQPRVYVARAMLLPQGAEGGAAGLAGIASQFGISLTTANPAQSPEFYVSLLESRLLLGELVESKFSFAAAEPSVVSGGDTIAKSGTLVTLTEAEGETAAQRREAAIAWVRDRLETSVDRETGIVRVGVRVPWADLAPLVTDRMLQLLNTFNLEQRQSTAAAERRFVEGRLEEGRKELDTAETRLQVFLERNRDWTGSPQLQLTHDRLEREVSLRHEIVLSLSQAYEQARIDEVRNTPVITVIEPPVRPAFPERRRLALKGLLALVAGGIVALIVALLREVFRRRREEYPEEYDEVVRLAHEAVDGVRRLVPGRRSVKRER